MVSRHTRGQAAMEFLMTYGWAILVVLVVIGALAYFGVLSPDTLLPEKCSLPLQLSCKDFSVVDTSAGPDVITLSVINSAGRSMTLRDFNVSSAEAITGAAGCFSTTATTLSPPTTLNIANGDTTTLTLNTQRAGAANSNCVLTNTGRAKDKFKIAVVYSWQDSPNIIHSLDGELLAKVQR